MSCNPQGLSRPVQGLLYIYRLHFQLTKTTLMYEGWNFNSGNYLFTTDTK